MNKLRPFKAIFKPFWEAEEGPENVHIELFTYLLNTFKI